MGYVELKVLNNEETKVAVGIDLGTTNSLCAVWKDGRPQVLSSETEGSSVPSVLYFDDRGEVTVGRAARDHAVADPLNTLFSIKRFMGRGLADMAEDLQRLPYRASETERGLIQFDVRGRKYTPQELSARILAKVARIAQESVARLWEGRARIVGAVITVPAYFDDTQRQATRDAARLAGIDVLRIVNEPTAASLAYGLDQRDSGNVVVYDLGGGTFDVSVLTIEDGVFRVLATAGDTHLGGDDLDRELVHWLRESIKDEVPEETLRDPAFLQAARLAAERCKIELSKRDDAELRIVISDHGLNWRRRVTRAEFEERIAPLVDRTLTLCRRALADAGLSTEQVDEVVLVGGSTRVPLVRARVEEFFGRTPHTELDPEQVVALGAAVQANILMGGSRDMLLMDVIPLSLGMETMGGAVSKIIARNSTIPCQATEGFTTYADDQTGIDFNVVQGERELAADCRSLGRFKLTGIPPMPAGMARVSVRFHVDADGLLTVTAKEESTGARAEIEVQPMHGLTDDEVEGMLTDSFTNAKSDFERRRVADLHVEIGTMLHAIERNLPLARERLDRESLADLDEALAASREAQRSEAVDEVQPARDALERASLPLAAVLMDDVAKSALAGKRLDEV